MEVVKLSVVVVGSDEVLVAPMVGSIVVMFVVGESVDIVMVGIVASIIPLSFHLQSFLAAGSFPMSQFFALGC